MQRSRTIVWSTAAALFTICLVTGTVGAASAAGSTPDATITADTVLVGPAVFVVPPAAG